MGFQEGRVTNNTIVVRGAREHNLKNLNVTLPRDKMVVVTGLSGSGKSSLAFNTIYAEGQRRYVESLSAYARQFLELMEKPDVDYIRGICPAIAIEQRVTTGNARSTVGSMTEIYDFLRLLFARIGRFYSPVSGQEVRKHEVSDVIDFIKSQPPGTRGLILIPFSKKYKERTLRQQLELLLQKGYTRLQHGEQTLRIEDIGEASTEVYALDQPAYVLNDRGVSILMDRFVVSPDLEESDWMRLADSVHTAFSESEGECKIQILDNADVGVKGGVHEFNNRFELDGIEFPEPTPQLFNYNNPVGACPVCEGYGRVMGIDPHKVIPDPTKTMAQGAVAVWKGEKYGEWLNMFLQAASHFDFPVHTPWQQLTAAQQQLVWKGNRHFYGITAFFKELEEKLYKIQNRVTLARYRGRTTCPECGGGRLKPEALCVRIGGKNIADLTAVPLSTVLAYVRGLELNAHDRQIAKRLLLEVENRLQFMSDLGLDYLSLDRISNTLSGGETQRIHLTRTLSSNLTASLYLLDEPSVGLHPRDTGRLLQVLKTLRDLGNTVVVVEHEEMIIEQADFLLDMGPEAGVNGGNVVYAGPYREIGTAAPESLTARYMSGQMGIPLPEMRRPAQQFLVFKNVRRHNLKNLTVHIPLHCLTVVSGVSGSGKTTLVRDIIYPALSQHLPDNTEKAPEDYDGVEGPMREVTRLEWVNQQPIGKSSRSNPVTYIKAYDLIRDLYAAQPLSKIRGYQARHFSFNVDGGRCDGCKGEGEKVVEMQFLADVHLECEECRGKRFKSDVLEVQYKGKNIFEILQLTVDEAVLFFAEQKDLRTRLLALQEVGLGYMQLGQSSSTLSGGEAQRVKLASFLLRENSSGHIFFIFDEPTTGLHFHDILKLLRALQALVEKGHTVLVVEHNMEVIKSADWVVDLGPEGGHEGGYLVGEGTPEAIVRLPESHTGMYLKEKLLL
jgi:excinuclease ABC subunit A